MNDDFSKPENELWDNGAQQTPRIFHAKCGGRVTWIKGEEHRCFKCSREVPPEEMEFPDEESNGTPTNQV